MPLRKEAFKFFYMLISEAAQLLGMKISTLRFYERRKIIKPSSRSASGYRFYSEADVKKLRFVKRAQELGFTLQEIKNFLSLSENKSWQNKDVAEIGLQKLEEIKKRIHDLKKMHKALHTLLSGPCEEQTECPVIESLT